MTTKHLVIMVKTPKAGRVKTRLSRDIGQIPATYFYRSLVTNVIRRVSADTRWNTVLAVTPDTDIIHPFWPTHLPRIAQGQGDLGHRMQHVMETMPTGPTVIIGTDIPEIAPEHISTAFRALGSHDAVFGPADDGGYWLVGLRRSPRVLQPFKNVRWSSEHTLSDTLANLKEASIKQIMTLRDVDSGDEYHDLKSIASRLIL